MGLWEKFGEFDSAAEINATAEGLRAEGDTESIYALAKENGIDREDAADFAKGYVGALTSQLMASCGKINVEKTELGINDNILISDWCDYICALITSDDDMAIAVRKKGKSLSGCIAKILKESFRNQWELPQEIKKAAGVNQKVTFGVPGMFRVHEIIKDYYLGGES